MPYIYKITNKINNKSYVGKTIYSIEKRWKEHCRDCKKKDLNEKRPLYIAMQKYGIENFNIIQIEECSIDELSDREKYWIEILGTFKNGYNATIGGDGSSYINYDEVVATYKRTQSITETASIMGICPDATRTILRVKNIPYLSAYEFQALKYGKHINMFSKNGEFVRGFCSAHEAARYLIENELTNCKIKGIRAHIIDVCKGKRKTAAGFVWKYAEE